MEDNLNIATIAAKIEKELLKSINKKFSSNITCLDYYHITANYLLEIVKKHTAFANKEEIKLSVTLKENDPSAMVINPSNLFTAILLQGKYIPYDFTVGKKEVEFVSDGISIGYENGRGYIKPISPQIGVSIIGGFSLDGLNKTQPEAHKPKEIPMMFSTDMVVANHAGTKSETRRTSKLKEININPELWYLKEVEVKKLGLYFHFKNTFTNKVEVIKCPYGIPGDILWQRETFSDADGEILFKADLDESDQKWLQGVWKPSMFLKRVDARSFYWVINIRCEQLHNIDYKDAINEGIIKEWDGSHHWYKNYLTGNMTKDAVESYYSLWDKINGKDNHKKNIWVWVITYKKK